MKAMVFAAGLGTRLRPLTDDRPKALVKINGRTMLDLVLARLRAFGITDVVVNAHHFADKLTAYLEANSNFGMKIQVSHEDVLLDTGGGLKKAAPLFLADAARRKEPILVHNVDVLSAIDFHRMEKAHGASKALATLAVQKRSTSRYLLFDENLLLCGRRIGSQATAEIVRKTKKAAPLAFTGIHIVSPRLFAGLTESGVFSIVNSYLRLAKQGEKIMAFRADEYYWRDLGRPADLEKAADDLRNPRLNGTLLV